MSLNPETITQLPTMLQADPAMLAQLQAETELAGVAAVIAKAVAAQGLSMNEADLMSHLAAEKSQASAVDMSDAELEQVAGGGVGDWATMAARLAVWRLTRAARAAGRVLIHRS